LSETEQIAPDVARRFNPLTEKDWDATLTARPDFSFFHGTAWLQALADSYGFTPHFFSLGDAVLPVMECDSWLTGRRGIALPFTDECAPLGGDKDSFAKVFATAVEFGRSRGWRTLELRGGRNFFGDGVPASVTFYGHTLDLAAGEDSLYEKMDGSSRQAVRKAEKDGVTVEISQSADAVDVFYRLQCLTRKRHGLPPQPRDFFVNIHRRILSQKLGMIAVAGRGGEKIAASVYFFLGGRAIYKYGASDFKHQNLRGSNLAMWRAVQWLGRQGVKTLDFGKTSLANGGLRRFKLNLGGTERKIEYVKFDLRKNVFVTDIDGVAGWHNAVFRALPVFASRAAGSLLYRHWA
jgi:hypothetical protein